MYPFNSSFPRQVDLAKEGVCRRSGNHRGGGGDIVVECWKYEVDNTKRLSILLAITEFS